ncbi:MAG TPA: hypothetical protein VFL81_00060 [Candidatus Saccharimonadales bacterium]|nr:hypothetical protein [Candidatus Saccharimonadales bacterium]
MDKAKSNATPPSGNQLTGLKKRQQIAQANKMIFIWVAVAAVAVSFCAVALQFLVREGLFNQKIINAKAATNRTLESNIASADQLKANVQALLADTNLNAVRTKDTDNNLQVVLDALPTDGDSTSFATSLQTIVLVGAGAKVSQLSTSGQFSGDGGGDSSAGDLTDSGSLIQTDASTLPFAAQINGTYKEVRGTLDDIAKTIRPINITTMNITGQDTDLSVTLNGNTFYLPAKTVSLGSKEITP